MCSETILSKMCLLYVWKGNLYQKRKKKNRGIRYDSFSQKYQGTSGQVLIVNDRNTV